MVERRSRRQRGYHGMRGELAARDQMVRSLKNGKVKWSTVLGNAQGAASVGDQVVDLFPGACFSTFRLPGASAPLPGFGAGDQAARGRADGSVSKHENKRCVKQEFSDANLMPAMIKVAGRRSSFRRRVAARRRSPSPPSGIGSATSGMARLVVCPLTPVARQTPSARLNQKTVAVFLVHSGARWCILIPCRSPKSPSVRA